MTPTSRSFWRQTSIPAVLILVWLAATAWLRPLALPDEGRYVGVAWEMMRSGDWLTPTLNSLPFFHKPPLFYWITAASMSLFGLNEWAARTAPLLGAWTGALALYLFVQRWWGERAGRMTLVALLVQPLFYIGGQFANLDMLVAGWITATIVLLAHAVLNIEQQLPYRRTLVAAYAMAALGVLSKGMIGAVLPALVILAWLAMLHRWRVMFLLLSFSGIAAFLLIAAPWFIGMQWRFDNFLDYFFIVQQFDRFTAGGFNNVQPFWFYPAVLILFSLPWLPWLYRPLTRDYLADTQRRPIRLLMWLWVLLITLFFSTPKSKLLGYILPAVPPLACLMADGMLSLGATSMRLTRLWWLSVTLSSAISIGAVLGYSAYPHGSLRHLATQLATQRQPDEPVFMLHRYYYDVPLYAKLTQPVAIVDDWTSPDVFKLDNGRKEMADAGLFAAERSALTLLSPMAFNTAVCSSPVSWVIGGKAMPSRYPFLQKARVVSTQNDETVLWRVDHLVCVMGKPAD